MVALFSLPLISLISDPVVFFVSLHKCKMFFNTRSSLDENQLRRNSSCLIDLFINMLCSLYCFLSCPFSSRQHQNWLFWEYRTDKPQHGVIRSLVIMQFTQTMANPKPCMRFHLYLSVFLKHICIFSSTETDSLLTAALTGPF